MLGKINIAKRNENGILALKAYNSYIYIWGMQNVLVQILNLKAFHPKMLCTKFGLNYLSGSNEDEDAKSLQQQKCTRQKNDNG